MWIVSLYAAAAVMRSAAGDGGRSFFVALAALVAAIFTEFLIGLKTGRYAMFDGSAAASALILALLLPNQTPPVFAALGAVFAMFIVKANFGGLGANWLNPAVAGWLFIRFSWPDVFDRTAASSANTFIAEKITNGGGYAIGTPWEILSQNGFFPDTISLTNTLKNTILAPLNFELPAGYLDFFASPGTGIIGDRGVYALLLGSIVIIALGIIRFSIPAVYLAVYLLLIKFAGALPMGGGLWTGDVFFGLFSGGTLITAFLLVTEPATSPKSSFGKILFAAAAAVLSFFFRYTGNEPYGAFFAVALLNTVTPIFRAAESRWFYLRIPGGIREGNDG
jgi:electron transport complex protein RnfD